MSFHKISVSFKNFGYFSVKNIAESNLLCIFAVSLINHFFVWQQSN